MEFEARVIAERYDGTREMSDWTSEESAMGLAEERDGQGVYRQVWIEFGR